MEDKIESLEQQIKNTDLKKTRKKAVVEDVPPPADDDIVYDVKAKKSSTAIKFSRDSKKKSISQSSVFNCFLMLTVVELLSY